MCRSALRVRFGNDQPAGTAQCPARGGGGAAYLPGQWAGRLYDGGADRTSEKRRRFTARAVAFFRLGRGGPAADRSTGATARARGPRSVHGPGFRGRLATGRTARRRHACGIRGDHCPAWCRAAVRRRVDGHQAAVGPAVLGIGLPGRPWLQVHRPGPARRGGDAGVGVQRRVQDGRRTRRLLHRGPADRPAGNRRRIGGDLRRAAA